MRKIEKDIYESYPPIVLYKDDLEKIIEEVSSEGKSVVISTEDYEYSSLDELINHLGNDNPKTLMLSLPETYQYINLTPYSAIVSLGEKSTQSVALLHNLQKYFLLNQRKPRFLFSNGFFNVFSASLMLFMLMSIIFVSNTWTYKWVLLVGCIIFYWLLIGYIGFISSKKHSTLILKRRSEVNFLKKNKDPIIVGLIVGLFVSVVGGFILDPVKKMFFSVLEEDLKEKTETEKKD